MATLARRNGEPIHVVQQRGGWSAPKVLLEHYADVLPDQAKGVAQRLEATILGHRATRRIAVPRVDICLTQTTREAHR